MGYCLRGYGPKGGYGPRGYGPRGYGYPTPTVNRLADATLPFRNLVCSGNSKTVAVHRVDKLVERKSYAFFLLMTL